MAKKETTIKSAYLHQALSWPGHPSERTISKEKYGKSLVLSFHEKGLLIQHMNGKNIVEQTIVPDANVANYVIVDAQD